MNVPIVKEGEKLRAYSICRKTKETEINLSLCPGRGGGQNLHRHRLF